MNIKNRLQEKRNDLGSKIPLNTPYVLLIDPSNHCNLRCNFCPTGHDFLIKESNRCQTILDFELYKKIINDTNEFSEIIQVLRLYKEGEPLVNNNFSEMVSYAKNNGKIARIDTTTNGILLNKELNRKIIDSGIDQINISVNGVTEEQIYKHTKRKIDFRAYVENIRDLCRNKGNCTIYVKSIEDILSEKEQKQFFELFGDFADRVFLEKLSPAWPDFELEKYGYPYQHIGNYGQEVEQRQVCPYLFYTMVINSDGTMSTCVGDWKHKQILGDSRKESLKELWNGKKLLEYQLEHFKYNKDRFPMCRECKVITHGCYDNIDKESDRVIKLLEKKLQL